MTLLEKLQVARARIEKGWCQRTYARNADGDRVGPLWPEATSWCLLGSAFVPAYPSLPCWVGNLDLEVRDALCDALPPNCGLADWNDAAGRTQPEVLALVDKAIEKASVVAQ